MVSGQIKVDAIVADSTDNMFLSAALEAGADFLVTGDHHLLQLHTYQGISIVSPAEFLAILERKE